MGAGRWQREIGAPTLLPAFRRDHNCLRLHRARRADSPDVPAGLRYMSCPASPSRRRRRRSGGPRSLCCESTKWLVKQTFAGLLGHLNALILHACARRNNSLCTTSTGKVCKSGAPLHGPSQGRFGCRDLGRRSMTQKISLTQIRTTLS